MGQNRRSCEEVVSISLLYASAALGVLGCSRSSVFEKQPLQPTNTGKTRNRAETSGQGIVVVNERRNSALISRRHAVRVCSCLGHDVAHAETHIAEYRLSIEEKNW